MIESHSTTEERVTNTAYRRGLCCFFLFYPGEQRRREKALYYINKSATAEISVLLFIFLCSLRERCERTFISKQRKELCFFFYLFFQALAFSQVQRSHCLVEAYVFWHVFSVVSAMHARTHTAQ